MTGADAAAVDTPWSAVALKRLFRVVGGSTPTQDPGNWDGDVCWVTPADLSGLEGFGLDQSRRTITPVGLSSCGTTLVPPGSLVLSTRAPIGSLGIAGRPLCTNQGCRSLVPRTDLDTRYFAYFLSVTTGELNAIGRGSTFMELSGEDLGAFLVPRPPLSVQRDVAAFLDYETARIDELVQEQEQLNSLAHEERAAVISSTLFSDSNAAPSVRLSVLSDILSGPAFKSDDFSDVPGGVRLLRGINVGVNRIRWDEVVYWHWPTSSNLERFALRAGDIVLGMDRPWIASGARQAIVRECDLPALLVQRVARLRARAAVMPKLLSFALESTEFREFVESDLTGVSVPHISTEQIGAFRIPVHSLPEQELRLGRALKRLRLLRAVVAESAQLMELLLERRSALITAAVTGQIDVSSWRPPDDWLVPEPA